MRLARTIRTRPRNGVAISEVLSAVLVSELLSPSQELWLVTGWVSDIPVIANPNGEFGEIGEDLDAGAFTLSDVLASLTRKGVQVRVAVREDRHNNAFLDKLKRRCAPGRLSIYSSPDLHEKVLCGEDWLLKGSMNFTWNGLNVHEESIELVVDQIEAAKSRLEFSVRWNDS
ncbi:phospholipase D-like domain-containing protein DpdK [Orlajensenia leifsoniae]|uniref:Phosphatidylserine/phosphatidylglycerophosphate/ cardiolipin synthase family protein n=1 Tax=Orlajensenia leifsoniae TaxID=2561933 RepID=A0A4Y9QSG6_9MICO|nr:phospholipase D-like domain-containing protein DpdK [Leifsonia flava]TFV95401.1 phosphatidylserine/phosphatidylglycerophosphate/cardiolipin synthase family protein [Leifsonia flava]